MSIPYEILQPDLFFQVDPYYPFHPSCRISIKSETRLRALPNDADKWTEELSEYFTCTHSILMVY